MPASGNGHGGHTDNFETVLADEHARIGCWRAACGRLGIASSGPAGSRTYDTNGLALSGGGIRSAAFCLGVLQALDGAEKIRGIDYLSTVSGGGYIGTAFTAGMNASSGGFPFATGTDDRSDNPAVGHLRNYSNYLMPGGFRDAVASVTVILRGLVINVAIIIAMILVVAGLTALMNPNQKAMKAPDFFGWENFPYHETVAQLGDLALTKLLLLAGSAGYVVWAFVRSLQSARPEFSDACPVCADFSHCLALVWIYGTALSAFLELQPFAIGAIYDTNYQLAPRAGSAGIVAVVARAAASAPGWAEWFFGPLASKISGITHYLAPLSALLAFFSKYFGDVLKTRTGAGGWSDRLKHLVSKAAIGIIALALPLVVWVIYLHVTIWADIGFILRPQWMQYLVSAACGSTDAGTLAAQHADTAQACQEPRLIAYVYTLAGLVFVVLAILLLSPNANSLHRLYRDRLSKAFLFHVPEEKRQLSLGKHNPDDPISLDGLQFADITPASGPLHILNTALNIQGSRWANKRGRQADFFSFSPAWCGSHATGYIKTAELTTAVPGLDIATVMAVSGAAASSNMGARSIRGLAPTLALLNIRLGFWMRNPKNLHSTRWSSLGLRRLFKLYLPAEMFSLLDEKSPDVYLTDGGHIENLGLYELLRRRCQTIIVVDAEADPGYAFQSLADAQRYARIDLGVRISLPWSAIQDDAAATDALFRAGNLTALQAHKDKAHVAIGQIDYGNDQPGVLIYVKASLTGDENDYILNYKSRHPDFPHETTGDQFFGEKQFEVYRALGNHAVRTLLEGRAHAQGMETLPGFEMSPSGGDDDMIEARKLAFAQLLT